MDEDNKHYNSAGFSMQEDKLSTQAFVLPFQGQYGIAKKNSSSHLDIYNAGKSLKEDCKQDLRVTSLVNDTFRGYPTLSSDELPISSVISDLSRSIKPYSCCDTAKTHSRYDSDAEKYAIRDNLNTCNCLKEVDPCSGLFESDGFSILSYKNSNAIPTNNNSIAEFQFQVSELAFNDVFPPNHKPTTAVSEVPKISENHYFENKPLSCSKCSAGFKFRSQLIRHNVLHHASSQPAKICLKCRAAFKSRRALTVHGRVHRYDYEMQWRNLHDKVIVPVCCNTCGAMFETERGVSMHRKVHNVNCGAIFPLNDSLQTNVKLAHQNVVCTGCGIKFSCRKELVTHKAKCPHFVPKSLSHKAIEENLLKQIREHKLLKNISGKRQMSK